MDVSDILVPQASLGEIFLRGTAVYLFIYFYFRFFRRSAGGLGLTDVLLVVLVADAAQSALAGEEHSLTAGLLTVATVAFWDFLLDWLGYRVPALRHVLQPPPLLLIRDGHVLNRNLSREMMTHEELRAQLRQHDVRGPEEVQAAFLEADGKLSVVKRKE